MRSNRKNLESTVTSANQLLRQTPDVRGPVVARGKALIADPNYPSAKQIKAVANVLAAQWQMGKLEAELPGAPELSPESRAHRNLRVDTAPIDAAEA